MQDEMEFIEELKKQRHKQHRLCDAAGMTYCSTRWLTGTMYEDDFWAMVEDTSGLDHTVIFQFCYRCRAMSCVHCRGRHAEKGEFDEHYDDFLPPSETIHHAAPHQHVE